MVICIIHLYQLDILRKIHNRCGKLTSATEIENKHLIVHFSFSKGNILERAEGLLQNEPFANVIASCSSPSSMKDIIESYTHDFIFQKLICKNEDECSVSLNVLNLHFPSYVV